MKFSPSAELLVSLGRCGRVAIRLDGLVHNAHECVDEAVAVAQLLARLVAVGKLQIGAAVAQHTRGIGQHGRVLGLTRRGRARGDCLRRGRLGAICCRRRRRRCWLRSGGDHIGHNGVLDESGEAVVQYGLLDLLARAQIPQHGRDALLDRLVASSPQQAHEGGNGRLVAHLELVVVVVLAVGEIAQSAARIATHVAVVGAEQGDEAPDATERARLGLHRVVLVAQVLQVGRSVGAYLVRRVREVLDHFGQGRVAPAAHHLLLLLLMLMMLMVMAVRCHTCVV